MFVAETINSKPNYYTTSSCAGRLIIVLQPPTQLLHVTQWESECDRNNNENKNQTELQQQKKERLNVEWVYVTHEENSTHETMWKTISERLNTLQPHQNNHEVHLNLHFLELYKNNHP
jgi:tRNA(Phe) wybutosine-synthesizing methylase Tyw3